MAKKTDALQYQSREELDGELANAVSDILSAEAEARKIIEQAEASCKAARLDRSMREREMYEISDRECAAKRLELIADAERRAAEECSKRVADARARGEKLVKDKREMIKKRAAELLDGVRLLGE